MKIALVSSDIIWESPIDNLSSCSNIIKEIISTTDSIVDLIVFPEFFTTGFSMNSEEAVTKANETIQWMKERSIENNCGIIGSIPVKEGELFFNRALFTTPTGDQYYYDKRHLFSLGGEDSVFTPGDSNLIVPFRGFNIAIQICYDLRFPVWSRNLNLSYDIMVNIANWPSGRSGVTEPLSRARAIENQSFFAFVNRSGSDPDNSYNGERHMYDFMGNALTPEAEGNFYSVYTLEYNSLSSFREKFPAWRDADNFKIIK